jgi:hypothetical protein
MLALSTCTSPPPLPASSLPDGIHFAQVLIRVKQEVGYYESSQPITDADWKKTFEEAGLYDKNGNPPAGGICGTGKIALNITKVQMDFLANDDSTHGASGGLKIPLLPASFAANVSPSVGLSTETIGSIEIKYTYYVPSSIPESAEWAYLEQHPDAANFKSALDGLRDGLIAATGHKPCFLDAKTIKAADPETVTFAVQLKQSASAGVGFDILLLNLSDTNTTLLSHANTITVTYIPTPTGEETKH